MNKVPQFICCVMLCLVVRIFGQDLPKAETATPATTASPAAASATPTPIPSDGLTLIPAPKPSPSGAVPPSAPNMPDISQLDQLFKQSAPSKEAAEHRAHVEWRKLKNLTVTDPAVVAAKASAEAAPTDLEKRNRLRAYYEIFYARMRALASSPEIVSYLDAMKKTHINRLAQPRVRPTAEPAKKAEPARESELPNE